MQRPLLHSDLYRLSPDLKSNSSVDAFDSAWATERAQNPVEPSLTRALRAVRLPVSVRFRE